MVVNKEIEEAKELEMMLGLVNDHYNSANDLASGLSDFNDRTQGAEPEEASNTCAPERTGSIGAIFDRLDSLGAALSRANAEFRRLSKIG